MNDLNPTALPFTPAEPGLLKNTTTALPSLPPPSTLTPDKVDPILRLESSVKTILPDFRLIPGRPNFRVHKAVREGGGEAYAIKYTDGSLERLAALQNEARTLAELSTRSGASHPAIRGCFGLKDGPNETPFLLLEHCARTLHQYQGTFLNRKVPDYISKFLMTQLLAGMEWIHSKNVIHRDLHPQHLMINGTNQPVLKIIAFGKSVHEDEVNDRYLEGHPYYYPPDVLSGACSCGTEYDMWSVGCIFAEMISGYQIFHPPPNHRGDLITYIIHVFRFSGSPIESERRRKLATLPWDVQDASWPWYSALGLQRILGRYWSPQSATFLNSFLQFDPESRVTATEARRSPYLVIAEVIAPVPIQVSVLKRRRRGQTIAYGETTAEVSEKFRIEEKGTLEQLLGCVPVLQ